MSTVVRMQVGWTRFYLQPSPSLASHPTVALFRHVRPHNPFLFIPQFSLSGPSLGGVHAVDRLE